MIRRRGQRPQQDDSSSSSDEDDAFTAMSRKRPKMSGTTAPAAAAAAVVEGNNGNKPDVPAGSEGGTTNGTSTTSNKNAPPPISSEGKKPPMSITSSMKRHHKPNDTRKANMDAIIEELEAEKVKVNNNKHNQRHPSSYHRNELEKKGSYVRPEEEHLTTNVFVGGLSPSVTEEDLSKLFGEFGELYSVKIMWPRTAEERQRNRNTGFVCFMERQDAEEAMSALSDTDPFNAGRLLMLRWGKNVKKDVRRGTGGLQDGPKSRPQLSSSSSSSSRRQSGLSQIEKPRHKSPTDDDGEDANKDKLSQRPISGNESKKKSVSTLSDIGQGIPYDESIHGTDAIRVEVPPDRNRFHFISCVAKYVSTDGSDLERRLLESEAGNETFKFLTLGNGDDKIQRNENIFYRWRIWSFCQGEGIWNWRTEPFVMFLPNGRYWIPPPLDEEEARNELIAARQQEARERQEKRSFQTGRQWERVKHMRRKGNSLKNGTLSDEDLRQLNKLIKKLTVSREKICEVMVFCYERSMAAKVISEIIKDSLLDDSKSVTIDMKIARLYLLSDVLYNSQQNVKNAFQYRTSIESMSPIVFRALGVYLRSGAVGRMTGDKLRKAISAVLGAWADWGVFNSLFLDELEHHFEGKEPPKTIKDQVATESDKDNNKESSNERKVNANTGNETTDIDSTVVVKTAQGDWVDVSTENSDDNLDARDRRVRVSVKHSATEDSNRQESTNKGDDEAHNVANNDKDEDLDGEDLDGEDLDGEDLDGEDLDGEDLDGDDLDGEELDDNIDGEDLDGEDLDGP